MHLGARFKKDVMVLMKSICRANKAQNKKEYLEAFLEEFEFLKLEVRLSADMKRITIKMQAEISLLMDEIEKQITGWRSSQP